MTSQNQLPEVGEPSQWLCAEEMYAHLRSRSAPYLRRLQHEFPQPGMRQLARRLRELRFDVRYDLRANPTMAELNADFESQGRDPILGNAILLKGRPPLIFMFNIIDDTSCNRLDTVLHECIHATGFLVNRFEEQPSGFETPEYKREDFVAIYGALCLADRLGLDLGDRRRISELELQILVEMCGYQSSVIAGLIEEAERAADFLAAPPRPSLSERLWSVFRTRTQEPTGPMPKPPATRVSLRPPGRLRSMTHRVTQVRIEGKIVPMNPRRN